MSFGNSTASGGRYPTWSRRLPTLASAASTSALFPIPLIPRARAGASYCISWPHSPSSNVPLSLSARAQVWLPRKSTASSWAVGPPSMKRKSAGALSDRKRRIARRCRSCSPRRPFDALRIAAAHRNGEAAEPQVVAFLGGRKVAPPGRFRALRYRPRPGQEHRSRIFNELLYQSVIMITDERRPVS